MKNINFVNFLILGALIAIIVLLFENRKLQQEKTEQQKVVVVRDEMPLWRRRFGYPMRMYKDRGHWHRYPNDMDESYWRYRHEKLHEDDKDH